MLHLTRAMFGFADDLTLLLVFYPSIDGDYIAQETEGLQMCDYSAIRTSYIACDAGSGGSFISRDSVKSGMRKLRAIWHQPLSFLSVSLDVVY
jgi:hypothetical protein